MENAMENASFSCWRQKIFPKLKEKKIKRQAVINHLKTIKKKLNMFLPVIFCNHLIAI